MIKKRILSMGQDTPSATLKASSVHPLTRFFAKWIDIFTFPIFMMILFMILLLPLSLINIHLSRKIINLLPWIVLFTAYPIMDSVFLATFGTSLGRYLLNITVRETSDKKLSWKNAVKRSFEVWIK